MEVKIYSFYDNNTGSANSKYAFLGSKWPVVELFLPMLQTISEKFINNLLGTLCVSCILCASKVKILSNMNNPQVTKARDLKKNRRISYNFLNSFAYEFERRYMSRNALLQECDKCLLDPY